ncbi:MAG TPA: S-layer homology domain-containing protein, partial [Clostridiales bacterium UBA8960]|nr:S-layer homology domain-containing protein [Clostridiales bacterium UBA8960]
EFSGVLQRAIYYGIIELDDKNMLHPKTELSREEAARIINRLVEYMDKSHFTR